MTTLSETTPTIGRRTTGGLQRRALLGATGVIGWLLTWEATTAVGPLAGTMGLPTAGQALSSAVAVAVDGSFWAAVGVSVLCAVGGLAIALVIGVALGTLIGYSPIAAAATGPTFEFLRPIPPVVLLPLILLLAGPSLTLAVALAALGAVWPILIQTTVGVRSVDAVALDTARVIGLPWHRVQTVVTLPSALPFIATGVRIATSLALMLSIGAGILGGAPGLGNEIAVAQQAGDPGPVFGLLLWAGVLGVVLNVALEKLRAIVVGGRARGQAVSV